MAKKRKVKVDPIVEFYKGLLKIREENIAKGLLGPYSHLKQLNRKESK